MADSIALLPAYASSRQLAVADPDLQVRGERGGGSQKNLFPLFGPQCGLKIRGSPPPPPPPRGSCPGSATDWYTMQRFRVSETQANGQVQRLKPGERSLENNNRPKKETNSTE